MKIAYFDCPSGISGDMILGAIVDAGLDPAKLKDFLFGLGLGGFDLRVERVVRHGISGTSVDVIIDEGHSHPFRHLHDMEEILARSGLDGKLREKSLQILRRLAEAEAKVHNIPVEQVHFHEIGAVDTIVDVVGSVWGMEAMGIEKIYASKLHTGTGFVECAHGLLPVPAPATLELLKGIPIYSTGVSGELVTPTGAAIISTLADSFGSHPPLRVEAVGYGAGKRDLEIPNFLRVTVGLEESSPIGDREPGGSEVVVECNIDDMNPEIYSFVTELLFEEGALDVFLVPVIMKKGRPGTILTVITTRDRVERIVDIILRETTTLGVRIHDVARRKAKRESISVRTEFGEVRVKVGRFAGRVVNVAPEYEDCKRVAKEQGIALKAVYDEARRLAHEMLRGNAG